MKFLLLFIILCAGCELIPTKTNHRHSRHSSSAVKDEISPTQGVGGVIEGNNTGVLVSPAWMKTYRAREQKHGAIPADDLIWQEGENYRVNSEVVNHFAEMKISDSSQKP